MGKTFDEIGDDLSAWIGAQRLFFVATAPTAEDGHVNASPKGGDTLRVLGPRRVAYLDLTGSGIETVAHVRENGRIVLMFCALEGAPRIVRLHGRGVVVRPDDAAFGELAAAFGPTPPGARAILDVEVQRISDACGYGVPLYRYDGERRTLDSWAEKKGPEGIAAYWREKNAASIDGLPGV